MKKKTKPKVKVARTTKFLKPRAQEVEPVTSRPLRLPPMSASIDIAAESAKVRAGQAIPAQPKQLNVVGIVKDCVQSYEQNTGAKANQTRLIDFVRWCEDNHGLL